jgi:hypothetical protein
MKADTQKTIINPQHINVSGMKNSVVFHPRQYGVKGRQIPAASVM